MRGKITYTPLHRLPAHSAAIQFDQCFRLQSEHSRPDPRRWISRGIQRRAIQRRLADVQHALSSERPHRAGHSPAFPRPARQVADNDLALGRVVEAVTKSVFWTNTVIFVIEDDPQSGYDHVDGHRSICLVVSPYTKRAQTISTFYNQVGIVHTMEQIMGIPPMNQMDAMGPLMTDCFTTNANFSPYNYLPNNVALNEMNPGTTGALNRKERYWARLSQKMDFSKPDHGGRQPDESRHLAFGERRCALSRRICRPAWKRLETTGPDRVQTRQGRGRRLNRCGLKDAVSTIFLRDSQGFEHRLMDFSVQA